MLEGTAIAHCAAVPAEILDRRHCSSDAPEPASTGGALLGAAGGGRVQF